LSYLGKMGAGQRAGTRPLPSTHFSQITQCRTVKRAAWQLPKPCRTLNISVLTAGLSNSIPQTASSCTLYNALFAPHEKPIFFSLACFKLASQAM